MDSGALPGCAHGQRPDPESGPGALFPIGGRNASPGSPLAVSPRVPGEAGDRQRNYSSPTSAVFYKLYNASKLEDGNLTAHVQAVKDTGEAVEFPPIALDRNHLEERAPGQIAVGFKLSTQSLSPGRYRFEITTEESDSGRATITETDFVVKQGSETAASGDVPSPVNGGQTRAGKASGPERVFRLDLRRSGTA